MQASSALFEEFFESRVIPITPSKNAPQARVEIAPFTI